MTVTPTSEKHGTESRSDSQLLIRVRRLMTEASELDGLPEASDLTTSEPTTLAGAAEALSEFTAAVLVIARGSQKRNRHVDQVTAIALRSLELADAVHTRLSTQRAAAYSQLRQGLERLRRIANSAQLLDRLCIEVVESCGFERAILTRVEDGEWLPWMAHFPDDPSLEQRFTEWMNQQRFPAGALGHDLLKLQPVLVRDATADPRVFEPMIAFSKTRSFVAAPITPAGRLVGVLYADRFGSDRPVDALDRDLLWAFAEDFGRMYERVALIERMRAQQLLIEKTFGFAETMMDSLANAEIELARTPEGRLPGGTDEPDLAVPPAQADVMDLLTAREAEVLALMVRGASNAVIAERLIIKEGTVKSHVKHILRKLDAINRSEAISRYIGHV
jgi:DNA-binding CsgD family transcriptional regulator